jgi:hypothetical protein
VMKWHGHLSGGKIPARTLFALVLDFSSYKLFSIFLIKVSELFGHFQKAVKTLQSKQLKNEIQ